MLDTLNPIELVISANADRMNNFNHHTALVLF
jgi:hypothetical protein